MHKWKVSTGTSKLDKMLKVPTVYAVFIQVGEDIGLYTLLFLRCLSLDSSTQNIQHHQLVHFAYDFFSTQVDTKSEGNRPSPTRNDNQPPP
jgi:hypothetical protein